MPNRREIAAAATRQVILAAARRLFAEHGYTATSVQQVADESGVAIQTIYSSVGSKADLVLALNDLIDEEADVARLGAQIGTETEPAKLLAAGVRLTRQLNERCGDIIRVLLSAEAAEPDIAAAYQDGMRRHQRGAIGLGQRLAALDALAAGTSAEQATTAFSVMTSPASWRQLTSDARWSFDDAETWLTDALAKLLLAGKR
jgi:AcrR family transcriptional regulator